MKTKWILAAMGSLWVCFAFAQQSTPKRKPEKNFSISTGSSFEFWTLDKKSDYTKHMLEDAGMKVKFHSYPGFNLGSQLTLQYPAGWLWRIEIIGQLTLHTADFKFDPPTGYQVQSFTVGQCRANTTLLPLGYKWDLRDNYSLALAAGLGMYFNILNEAVEKWDEKALMSPGGLFDWSAPKVLSFFYATQVQAAYKRFFIAANMNWQMQLPNDENYFYVDQTDWYNKGNCAYNYHTLDLKIGYQF